MWTAKLFVAQNFKMLRMCTVMICAVWRALTRPSYLMRDKTHYENSITILKLRHRKLRSIDKDSEFEDETISNSGTESTESITNAPKESQGSINELEKETIMSDESFDHREELTPDHTTADNFKRTGDNYAPNTVIGSLRRKNSASESYDYSDTHDSDKENIKIGKNENDIDDMEHSSESGEILIYTPNSKTLSQDVVLDLKARNGHIPSEEHDPDDDLKQSDENVPTILKFPKNDTDLRSGYVSPDYKDVKKPLDYKHVNSNFNERPNFAYNSDRISQFNQANNARPEKNSNNLLNSPPIFSPLYLNNINSKELLYPNPNSREYVWGPSNAAGQLRNTVKSPYFGFVNPNSQLYYPRISERCSACFQTRYSSQERNFKRSSPVDSNTIETAHGRSKDFDPLEGNAYPFSPDPDIVEVKRIQGISDHEFYVTHQDHQGLASQEQILSARNVQLPGIQTQSELFPKVPVTLPPFVPRNKPILFSRRIGLGGLQKNTSHEHVDDTSAMDKKYPEQHFATDVSEEPKREHDEPKVVKLNDEDGKSKEKLFAQDYYRVDSKETDVEKLSLTPADEADSHEKARYKAEVSAGDLTELLGTNPHYFQTTKYIDLGRRFVLQYPYEEIDRNEDIEGAEDNSLTPKLAPPELVLAVARESALLEAAKPVNPSDEFIRKDILRTGQYWNAFWKEDINPNNLRTIKRDKMESVRVKLSPGTELYDYVSKLQQSYPKLLYVININKKK